MPKVEVATVVPKAVAAARVAAEAAPQAEAVVAVTMTGRPAAEMAGTRSMSSAMTSRDCLHTSTLLRQKRCTALGSPPLCSTQSHSATALLHLLGTSG